MDKGEAIQRLIESGVMPTPEAIKSILEGESAQASEYTSQATTPVSELKAETKDLSSVEITQMPDFQPKKYAVKDFVAYFRVRYEFFKNLLVNRPELTNATSIARLQQGEKTTIIAYIHSMKKLPTGTLKLTLEDLTGKISAIISIKNIQTLKATHLCFQSSHQPFFLCSILRQSLKYSQK